MAEELTPMMRQYLALKREIPAGAILMFRLGDFYEMFGEDAVKASPVLGATLTHRGSMPMCGVPYHAVNSYLAKLVRAGMTAALCDQVEDPRTAKGLVRREITRIVTPGTVTEDGILDETAANYIVAVSGLSIAALDLPTGEFFVESFDSAAKLDDALERYRPAETLKKEEGSSDAWIFSHEAALDCLLRHFGVVSLDGFGLSDSPEAVSAAGALLHYVGVTLRHSLAHVRRLSVRRSGDALVLDSGTLRHLQLVPSPGVARFSTLLGILDVTKTPMGARALRRRIECPMARSAEINAKLDEVQRFVSDRSRLSDLRELLSGVRDLERLVQKVDSGRANARDLRALAASLEPLPAIIARLGAAVPGLAAQDETVNLIKRSISEEPPALLADGGFIADGYNAELDELREATTNGHKWLADFQAREQQRTGMAKLRVKHVPAFGFLIEVPKAQAALAPADYIRRQTLTTAERFVTPELKEHETKVLGAQQKAVDLEQRLFADIIASISRNSPGIQSAALALGELDATLSLADRALAAGYTRPEIDDSDVLEIEDGRHPVIEQLPDAEPFVPNSAHLNCTTDQIALITGPNMAGKSTYIRQVATIAIMAQMGSFVPASRMRLGVLDRVFTRIGAADDLSRGRSTFLVEMQETANILNNATRRSLIVLDEIGRGTSTFDGISIAWAVAEYIHSSPVAKAKTLFATHYHELADLEKSFDGVVNYTVKVKEEGGRIVFLRRIAHGVAEKSFGIHVAAMAGLPPEVVKRASEILANLEANELDVNSPKMVRKPRRRLSDVPGQMTFF
ncbi:MAG: DNA mismatch repair protein MutS [Kiritimatiellae bacterium]|nr:DNA mismatch repair protein MutS [Kiritimatiellia bacterium]